MRLSSLLLVLAAILLAGCGSPGTTSAKSKAPTGSAEDFLKWSMDEYKGYKTFQSSVELEVTSPSTPRAANSPTVTFDVAFEAPDKYRLDCWLNKKPAMLLVSDGEKILSVIGDGKNRSGTVRDVPRPFAIDQMFSETSTVSKFFAGSAGIDNLVDRSKAPISFGADTNVLGESAKSVKFYAVGRYGNVEIIIGKNNGHVYRIRYDSEPVPLSMKSAEDASQAPKLEGKNSESRSFKLLVTEYYSNIKTDQEIVESRFDTKLPKGVTDSSLAGS